MSAGHESAAFEPIAIVGQACVLPGALTPQSLWQAVRDGRDLLSSAPAGRWRLPRERVMGSGPDHTWSDRGGYVHDFESVFEPDSFSLDVRTLDPLFQWLLHVSREALRSSGGEGGEQVGAIFGNLSFPSASMARFAERVWLGDAFADAAGIARTDPRNRFGSGLPAHLVAKALRLGAGAFCLDAACASSLYAIKLACDRLHDRSADVMLAGAVNCADDLFIHIGFCALQALSRSGRSRPFHREADGLVPAEGAGAVVLKRLVDAESSGDRILGLIRGIGLSNDGRAAGMLAPSEEGQIRATEAAYRMAGLSPSDISLLECHATGTIVGDRTEIRSMARVFERARDLPIGSLKSNFGHAITAAGVAGLLKVLGAIGARERPPTLHADSQLKELADSPLRLLNKLEPWPSEGPRRAGVSAFGFGGCNAHLIVEEYVKDSRPRARPITQPSIDVAIVGIGAAVGTTQNSMEFEEALSRPVVTPMGRASHLALPTKTSRFPPRDLSLALAQQTWLLAVAHEALANIALPSPERLGVFVGMGCDPEVARYGARWRIAELARAAGVDERDWARLAEQALVGPLEAAGVLGTLPNLPANRLNFQLNAGGPGFTVSSEELSGVRALEIAARALRNNELDAALVGAADFSCESVHEAALKGIGIPSPTGDAALALVLMRADDARRRELPILAIIDQQANPSGSSFSTKEIDDRFGRAHAASGLVSVAAAALACARESKAIRVEIQALEGQRANVSLQPGQSSPSTLRPRPISSAPHADPVQLAAHPPAIVLPALPDSRDAHFAWMQLGDQVPKSRRMPRAPAIRPILQSAHEPVVPPAHVVQWLANQQTLLARVHRDFVEAQSSAELAFIHVREKMAQRLLEIGSVVAVPLPPPPPLTASMTTTRPGPKLERDGLLVHATGRISEIFGPQFAKQDGFARQVRMPEPPLLLADRLLGIDAVPGSMGKGRLWTETVVKDDGWYLHDGRMPAGLMIEAGQADLMLISYLGVDFLNRGERVYRLLGCDLTYHRSLPVPGEKLSYEIRIDGHAQQGDVRLFFFQYDCAVGGEQRLTVRNGQAGFFTEAELDDSAGVLWDAATAEHKGDARLDPPAVKCEHSAFTREQLEALANGQANRCFGRGFEGAATHTRTPRIAGGRMLLLDEVTDFAPVTGGPWQRGYLRAIDRISPEDWFMQGHFKGDPCMPGTLMFEGCLEAMAIYLAGIGYTLDKDGWRFEPVPDEAYRLRCRGQVTPRSRELVYELFVEEVHDGPQPTLWADLLCTVDGLKAFHCRRMGLRLVPGWPMDSYLPANRLLDARPVAQVDGFAFGAKSLLACAWGRPSQAFGRMYEPFDGPRRVPRLPGPPYLFMSRVAQVEGEIGAMQVGSSVVVEYDIPSTAWYFDANGAPTMPFCVLLEAALQPCGWLASYVGSALGTDQDLFFRNLDGDGKVLAEIPPDAGTLITRVKLTSISKSAGMIIESFDVSCAVASTEDWVANPKPAATPFSLSAASSEVEGPSTSGLRPSARGARVGDVVPSSSARGARVGDVIPSSFARGARVVYELKTVFGFFPKQALEAQRGLPIPDDERDALTAPSGESVDLTSQPAQFFASGARLPPAFLLMIPRVTGIWLDGGKAKLGRFRSEAPVDPSSWFFKAHFFQDPVQPGSLGLEAMLQLLQFAMIRTGLTDGENCRFEPIAIGEPLVWKYRGQVRPTNKCVSVILDLMRVDREARVAVADASLWVDGLRIYEAKGMAMRAVVGPVPLQQVRSQPLPSLPFAALRGWRSIKHVSGDAGVQQLLQSEGLFSLDESPWLADHRPTWTVPALPLMSMVAHLCDAASLSTANKRVIAVENLRALRWLPIPSPVRWTTRVEPAGDNAIEATLLAWRDASRADLSRFDPVAKARIILSDSSPDAPTAWPAPDDAVAVPSPYESGALFHGPAFQLLRSLSRAKGRASAIIDCAKASSVEIVLDALTHSIPHDSLSEWDPAIDASLVAYPQRLEYLRFFAEIPLDEELRCETRYLGLDEARCPRFGIQAIAGEAVVLELELVETLFPKGPIGRAPPLARREFLRDRQFVPDVRLSREREGRTHLADGDLRESDWLPGTLACAYATVSPDPLPEIAAKEHVSARAQVHPSTVHVDGERARCDSEPLNQYPLSISRSDATVEVRDAGPCVLDLTRVREYWARHLALGRWPVEDLYYGLAERFVRRVRLASPRALSELKGHGALYLANHQVAIESLMFSVLLSGLTGVPTITLAKAEHRTSWLGLLIKHSFSYPGAKDPGVITFFDRAAKDELPRVVLELAEELKGGNKSVMVHVEGTRALSCRAPVAKMSGAFLDMAIATGTPIVPVRFIGGLPVEPAPARLEFPLGMGRQDFWIGDPIAPSALEKLNYKERKDLVVAAINSLGPPDNGPLSSDPEFAAEVAEWPRRSGASDENSVLYQTLLRAPAPCEETQRLLEAIANKRELGDDPKGRWLAHFARQLGPR